MRVTNNMLVNNMVYNLNQNLRALEKLQYQKATGKKFKVPSDDPIGVSKSLKLNTDISKLEQYKRNVSDARSWMIDTEAALDVIGKVLKRAYELTVDASNGTKTTEDLKKIEEEIVQLREELVQVGNTTHADRYIFSGYKTDEKLFDEDGNYNIALTMKDDDEEATDETNETKKKAEIFEYNIGVSETVKVNTLGGKVFGVVEVDEDGKFKLDDSKGDYTSDVTEGNKPYLIAVFDELSGALTKNDQEIIQESITRLQECTEQVLAVRSEVGAKMNRLDLTEKKLDVQIESVTELLSYNEDVDMAEISMQIAMAENVYVSSLMTGAKVIQPTLVEFLR